MCGIAGIFNLDNRPVDPDSLDHLVDGLAHRGPDDRGVHIDGPVGIGNRRLAVIDLSSGGHQPMQAGDQDLWITFNGEIYNFQELRESLSASGHEFRSDSDTEVILNAYKEWGQDCVQHLAGMFAFAIWDGRTKELFVARDRLGVKPVYYTSVGDQFVFCSEVHGLYEYCPPTLENINPAALDYFLAFGSVPANQAFINGIEKLLPGHTLTVSDGSVSVRKYWSASPRPSHSLSYVDAVDEVDRLLKQAVEKRLVSDAPLGFFLSGGIDSGLITSMAAASQSNAIKTFTVRFDGTPPHQQEHAIARRVAESVGAEHTEFVVESGMRSILPKIAWHFGEPFADISALPTFKVSEKAREHITVALTGDGGDESFAGYANVVASRRAERVRPLYVRPIRGPVRGALSVAARFTSRAARARGWVDRWLEADTVNQYNLVNHWDLVSRRALYVDATGRSGHALSTVSDVQDLSEFDLSDPEMHLFTDLRLRLPSDYLPKVDITSGMASLEVRSPFLDSELAEFAARLPLDVKMRGGAQKALLRDLAARYLPEDVVKEPKRGFAPPLSSWLQHDWRDIIEDHVGTRLATRDWVLDGDVIRRTVREHLSGAVDHTQRLWTLATLEIWLETFVDRTLTPADSL